MLLGSHIGISVGISRNAYSLWRAWLQGVSARTSIWHLVIWTSTQVRVLLQIRVSGARILELRMKTYVPTQFLILVHQIRVSRAIVPNLLAWFYMWNLLKFRLACDYAATKTIVSDTLWSESTSSCIDVWIVQNLQLKMHLTCESSLQGDTVVVRRGSYSDSFFRQDYKFSLWGLRSFNIRTSWSCCTSAPTLLFIEQHTK